MFFQTQSASTRFTPPVRCKTQRQSALIQASVQSWLLFQFAIISLQGFFGRPLRGRFSTVLLRRYLTMMLCTVDLGILSSCPMAPSDLPSFQRSTTRCRCITSCSLVFWQAAVGPPAAPQTTPPVAPAAAAAAASVGADKRQTGVEARREEQDNVTVTGPCRGILF